jgi:hypothetical protein
LMSRRALFVFCLGEGGILLAGLVKLGCRNVFLLVHSQVLTSLSFFNNAMQQRQRLQDANQNDEQTDRREKATTVEARRKRDRSEDVELSLRPSCEA